LKLFSFSSRQREQIKVTATALLPNFGALVYGRAQHAVNRRCGFFLRVWDQLV
jgi:hypothetical protein